jgi:hypothetical protein
MWVIHKHQFVCKKIMLQPCESLGKNICHLKIARHMRKRDSLSFKRLTDEVATNLNMFSAFIEDEID